MCPWLRIKPGPFGPWANALTTEQPEQGRDDSLKVKTTSSQSLLELTCQKHERAIWRPVGFSGCWAHSFQDQRKVFPLWRDPSILTIMITWTNKHTASEITTKNFLVSKGISRRRVTLGPSWCKGALSSVQWAGMPEAPEAKPSIPWKSNSVWGRAI